MSSREGEGFDRPCAPGRRGEAGTTRRLGLARLSKSLSPPGRKRGRAAAGAGREHWEKALPIEEEVGKLKKEKFISSEKPWLFRRSRPSSERLDAAKKTSDHLSRQKKRLATQGVNRLCCKVSGGGERASSCLRLKEGEASWLYWKSPYPSQSGKKRPRDRRGCVWERGETRPAMLVGREEIVPRRGEKCLR